MTKVWALTLSAADVDAAARAGAAREMEEWVAGGGDGVALVTCHRVELYGVGLVPVLAAVRKLQGKDAITHLLRVAAGLESVIVGEDEVLHQVREASNSARDRRLQRLFQIAIETGRKARSGRTESSGNLAQRAVAWLLGKVDLYGRMVVVAGAGRMGATLAHSLTQSGAEVTVSSRDANRAIRLARVYAGRGVDLRGGAELVEQAAAVAVALGGPWIELQAIPGATLPPIADISAPPAVPDGMRQRLNGGFLGIDDLYLQSNPLPGAYIKDAERLVAAGTTQYMAWLERPR